MTAGPLPPRVAERLIMRVLPPFAREVVVGDMQERFRVRVARDGERRARRWYWRQALSFAWRVPAARLAGGLDHIMEGDTPPDMVHAPMAAGFASELRFAFRSLRRRPGLTVAAVAVLSFAVGANTTVFSVVKAVLLERLPFPDPGRLVMLWDAYPEIAPDRTSPITLDHYRAWVERTDLFASVGAFETTTPSLLHGEWPDRIEGALVTSNLLHLLGARPVLGRLLLAEDEAPGAAPVVVLSHGLWESRFGSDPTIIGRQIRLGGVPTIVVGVTGEGFWFYDPYSATRSYSGRSAEAARLWQPLPANPFDGETDYPRYRVIARLRDGVSVDAAAAAVATARSLMHQADGPDDDTAVPTTRLLPLDEQILAESRPRLLGLFGAVSLVLLIAGVNLVSLLLVHVESRRSEFAVRAALGASRRRLALQPILESVLLAIAGGLTGLGVARVATGWLVGIVPRGLPLAHRVDLDVSVAGFAIGLAILAGLAIGLAAALRVDSPGTAMAGGSRTASATRSSRRLHGSLVAVEVALSLVLLIAATLLLRSLSTLHATDTGFDPKGVITFDATLESSLDDPADPSYFVRLESALADMPGVDAVGSTSALPFSRWVQTAAIAMDGEPMPARVAHRKVSPGYFDAIGLPVRAGRSFSEADNAEAPPVAVVNRAFVQRWLGGNTDPIGRTITVDAFGEEAVHTIVGVVENVKHSRLFEADLPILYAPVRQSRFIFQRFAVRVSAGDPQQLVEPIRRIAASIDPAQPLQDFIAFETLVAQSIEEESFYTKVLGAFAVAAVLLTIVGIYGVVAWVTRQRDREVGIRMALGAGAGSVRCLVVRQGLAPVAIGLGAGWLGGLAATGLLRGLLHGIAEHDTRTFALATLVFALVAAAACLVPANRAARVSPVAVLRGD